MSSSANNLPLVPGNWRPGSDSNFHVPNNHWRPGGESSFQVPNNNSWNRPSPALPPFSYTQRSFRDGEHTGSVYNNPPAVQGNWRSGSDSDVSTRNNNWNRPPQALPYRPVETTGRPQDPWRSFEDRVRTGPFGINSFPSHPFSPLQIILQDDETSQDVNPRLRQFIQESPPRIRGQWQTQLTAGEEESVLTQDEQKKALKKLKKEVYNPHPKSKNRRWSLYYRDSGSDSFSTREQTKDEDGKGCAICLEDFVPKQEVLVTPCNHMFHEDCITPWVKSNGQCPVCRFPLGEKRRETTFPLNNNTTNMVTDRMAVDFISLITAMEEAFEWVNVPH